MDNEFGANDFTLDELDELFKDEMDEQSPAQEENTDHQPSGGNTDNNEETKNSIDTTKAFLNV